MAGAVVRVRTVVYAPRYTRVSAHIPERFTEDRQPTAKDVADATEVPARYPGKGAGPCGTVACARPSSSAWQWTIWALAAYIDRWGSNPLGASRLGTGAKIGMRGRGPQDYMR